MSYSKLFITSAKEEGYIFWPECVCLSVCKTTQMDVIFRLDDIGN